MRFQYPRWLLPISTPPPIGPFESCKKSARLWTATVEMIEVQNLHKHYGRVEAVKSLSFRAPNGAITGLLGPNGAGKTTALRMISGVLKPDSGRIQFDRPEIGALLDHIGLYARLTARENLEYFGELRGISGAQLRTRVDQVLHALGLANNADRRTAGFSQGERMKTALGRVLIHSPQNLLLDEPTNGLDIPTVRSLRTLLRQLRNDGACVVYSSHVLDEVRMLCDHIVVVAGGRVVAQGSAEELCRETASDSLEDAFVKLTSGQEALECSR